MTPDTDPIVAAVAEARQEAGFWGSGFDWDKLDRLVVTAHRRAVLDQRDDGHRWARLGEMAQAKLAKSPPGAEVVHVRHAMLRELLAALAALADAEIARRQAEADRDILSRLRDEALGKSTDYCEMILAVRERGDALLDGELAHRSRDYGRGVAQATRDMLAALDGPKDG